MRKRKTGFFRFMFNYMTGFTVGFLCTLGSLSLGYTGIVAIAVAQVPLQTLIWLT